MNKRWIPNHWIAASDTPLVCCDLAKAKAALMTTMIIRRLMRCN